MDVVRSRVDLIRNTHLHGLLDDRRNDLDIDFIFVQLRKVLEEIVLASLSASNTEYVEAYNSISKDWQAKVMLTYLAGVNPDFYPIPLTQVGRGHRFTFLSEGFLTKQDFPVLYATTEVMLHVRNRYSDYPFAKGLREEAEEWAQKILSLLDWHTVRLINSSHTWIVNVPRQPRRPVRAFEALSISDSVLGTKYPKSVCRV